MTRARWRFLKKFSLINLFIGTPRLSAQFGNTCLPYKQRYVLDFLMRGPKGRATVRSVWIVLAEETLPRLLSCYVL